MGVCDFLLISKDPAWTDRCRNISAEFGFTFSSLNTVDELSDREVEFKDASFVLLSAEKVENEGEIAGTVQVVRQSAPNCYILVVISGKLKPSVAAFIKKSGANAVLVEREFFLSSKLEFISSQKIKSSYLPIKASELLLGSKLIFPLFHILPLNKKFLPVLRAGDEITKDKLEKLLQINEIYIRRDDAAEYQKYVAGQNDKSAEGLVKRCRAQYLSLFASYVDLVLMISDQSEGSSFKLGADLYMKCNRLSSELMTTLGATGNAWAVISNSSIGEFGSVQRAPARAAYAGLLSLHSGIGQPVEIMIACLLSDVGLLEIQPDVTRKLRKNESLEGLHPADLAEYQDHPNKSLKMVLSRKLSLPEEVKNMILMSHERLDQRGFPQRVQPDKITMETMIVQLSEILDNRAQIRMGEERPLIEDVKKQLFNEHIADSPILSRLFLEKIRKPFNEI